MRLDVVKGKRTYFGNTVEMKTLCVNSIRKLESELVQLFVCPVLSRIVFPTVPPSLIPQINGVALKLRKLGLDLEQEDDAAGFLGVTLDCNGPSGLLEMKQTGLIKRVIEALGLDDGYTKGKHTPAESKPLVKDAEGEGVHGGFSYSSVIGMLLYLSGHT
jgi:hypothetical protein